MLVPEENCKVVSLLCAQNIFFYIQTGFFYNLVKDHDVDVTAAW